MNYSEKNLCVIIHSHNEELNIKECIESAHRLSKTVVLIDMESTDKTVEIASKMNVVVYSFPHAQYVEPAREFGIEKARTDWVLILDADERIDRALAEEIKTILSQHTEYTHYKIKRKNLFGRIKWLRRGGWWPDEQIRLIQKKYFKGWPTKIHSTPRVEGSVGLLHNSLSHFFHGNLTTMVEKTIIYEEIEAELLFKAGRKVSTLTFFRKFFGELYRRLLKRIGFMDGPIGIIEGIYQAHSKTITQLFLYEKKESRSL